MRRAHGAFVPLLPLLDRQGSDGTSMPPVDRQLRLHAYLITLSALGPAEERARRMLTAAHAAPSGSLRVTAIRGVRSSEALGLVGVSIEDARAVFGAQASHAEFANALGCALSHLNAARRALADGASPALILEDDAVGDLTPLWPMDLSALVARLPPSWEAVQLAMLADQEDWDELRNGWRAAHASWGRLPLMRRSHYWSTAAYLLHARGARRLVRTYQTAEGRWSLGAQRVPCVQADTCVIYSGLRDARVYVATPPFFTCSERPGSSIDGHGKGVQREVHVLSRLQSLDFAAEAYRQEAPEDTSDGTAHASADETGAVEAAAEMPAFAGACTKPPDESSAPHMVPFGAARDAAHSLENVYVHRRPMAPTEVLRFEQSAPSSSSDASRGVVSRFVQRERYERAGVWESAGRELLVRWTQGTDGAAADVGIGGEHAEPSNTVLFCRVDRVDGSYTYARVGTAKPAEEEEELAPLLPPAATLPAAEHTSVTERWRTKTREEERARTEAPRLASLPFRFWIHDGAALWWRPLLQCVPDWDIGLDAQNSAEVWLLSQLSVHPNRTEDWRDASLIVLPVLPKTSLHAQRCLGTDHAARLAAAVGAMVTHPAYRRRVGHDHVLLFNYWDAWGAFGQRGSASHAAFENVTLGWHETQDAAWGMANHRHVGKCQFALPYVESAACARRTPAELLSVPRPNSVFFSGAAADFDTQSGDACPNVARHALEVRRAFLSLDGTVENALVRSLPHNLRACNGSAACEASLRAHAAADASRSRYCLVAAGDTPSTGRMYDSIACLCVPLIVVDDLQLPFPHVAAAVPADAYGVRLREAQLLADPMSAVRRALMASGGTDGAGDAGWAELQAGLLRTRRVLAYRRPGSLVASLALREAWSSCVHSAKSGARPPATVAKC